MYKPILTTLHDQNLRCYHRECEHTLMPNTLMLCIDAGCILSFLLPKILKTHLHSSNVLENLLNFWLFFSS